MTVDLDKALGYTTEEAFLADYIKWFHDEAECKAFIRKQRAVYDRFTLSAQKEHIKLLQGSEDFEGFQKTGKYRATRPPKTDLTLSQLLESKGEEEVTISKTHWGKNDQGIFANIETTQNIASQRLGDDLTIENKLYKSLCDSANYLAAGDPQLVRDLLASVSYMPGEIEQPFKDRSKPENQLTKKTKVIHAERGYEANDVLGWNDTLAGVDLYNKATKIPPAVVPFHEFVHKYHRACHPIDFEVRIATPHRKFTNFEELATIELENQLLTAMNMSVRESHKAINITVPNVKSTMGALRKSTEKGEFQAIGEHSTKGRITEIREDEMDIAEIISDKSTRLVTYKLREVIEYMNGSAPRIYIDGKSKRADNALKILKEAKDRGHIITVGVDNTGIPLLVNDQMTLKSILDTGEGEPGVFHGIQGIFKSDEAFRTFLNEQNALITRFDPQEHKQQASLVKGYLLGGEYPPLGDPKPTPDSLTKLTATTESVIKTADVTYQPFGNLLVDTGYLDEFNQLCQVLKKHDNNALCGLFASLKDGALDLSSACLKKKAGTPIVTKIVKDQTTGAPRFTFSFPNEEALPISLNQTDPKSIDKAGLGTSDNALALLAGMLKANELLQTPAAFHTRLKTSDEKYGNQLEKHVVRRVEQHLGKPLKPELPHVSVGKDQPFEKAAAEAKVTGKLVGIRPDDNEIVLQTPPPDSQHVKHYLHEIVSFMGNGDTTLMLEARKMLIDATERGDTVSIEITKSGELAFTNDSLLERWKRIAGIDNGMSCGQEYFKSPVEFTRYVVDQVELYDSFTDEAKKTRQSQLLNVFVKTAGYPSSPTSPAVKTWTEILASKTQAGSFFASGVAFNDFGMSQAFGDPFADSLLGFNEFPTSESLVSPSFGFTAFNKLQIKDSLADEFAALKAFSDSNLRGAISSLMSGSEAISSVGLQIPPATKIGTEISAAKFTNKENAPEEDTVRVSFSAGKNQRHDITMDPRVPKKVQHRAEISLNSSLLLHAALQANKLLYHPVDYHVMAKTADEQFGNYLEKDTARQIEKVLSIQLEKPMMVSVEVQTMPGKEASDELQKQHDTALQLIAQQRKQLKEQEEQLQTQKKQLEEQEKEILALKEKLKAKEKTLVSTSKADETAEEVLSISADETAKNDVESKVTVVISPKDDNISSNLLSAAGKSTDKTDKKTDPSTESFKKKKKKYLTLPKTFFKFKKDGGNDKDPPGGSATIPSLRGSTSRTSYSDSGHYISDSSDEETKSRSGSKESVLHERLDTEQKRQREMLADGFSEMRNKIAGLHADLEMALNGAKEVDAWLMSTSNKDLNKPPQDFVKAIEASRNRVGYKPQLNPTTLQGLYAEYQELDATVNLTQFAQRYEDKLIANKNLNAKTRNRGSNSI